MVGGSDGALSSPSVRRLHVMTRALLLVAVGMHGPSSDPVRESAHAVSSADPIERRIRGLGVVVALQVPDRSESAPCDRPDAGAGSSPSHHRGYDWDGCGGGRACDSSGPPLPSRLTLPISPKAGGRSCNPEAPTSPADVADLLGVLSDPLLSPDLTLIFGHLDPPDCPPSS